MGSYATSRAIVRLLLIISIGCATGLYAWRTWSVNSVEYGEGPILAMVERMKLEPISRRWLEQPPYTLCTYGPGFHWLVMLASQLAPAEPSLLPGRCVVLIAFLATAALIGLAIARRTSNPEQGLVAALAYLISPVALYWVPAHRVDVVAVFFSCAAYLAVGNSRRSLLASAVLIVAGSLAKQTAALSALGIFLHLLIVGRRRDAAWFAIAVSLLGGSCWLILDRASGGFFWIAAIRGHQGAMLPEQGLWHALCALAWPVSWLCLLILGRLVYEQGIGEIFRSLFCQCLVINFALMTLFSARVGATQSYFLETCALGSMVIGLYGLPLLRQIRVEWVRTALTGFAAISVLAPLVAIGCWRGCFTRIPESTAAEASRYVAQTPAEGIVLADGDWQPWITAGGRKLAVNDAFSLRLLIEHGTLNPAAFVESLQRGGIPLVVLDQSLDEHLRSDLRRWPDEVLAALDHAYVQVVAKPGLWIYQPRSRPAGLAGGAKR